MDTVRLTAPYQATNVRPERAVTFTPWDLQGFLVVSRAGQGFVLFAHGSGSRRLCQRNRRVAARLQQAGLGTLLLDLLLENEAADLRNVLDLPLLAERLFLTTEWVRSHQELASRLTCPKEFAIVPGSGHLFEEPGTLEMVTALALGWFMAHLRPGGAA